MTRSGGVGEADGEGAPGVGGGGAEEGIERGGVDSGGVTKGVTGSGGTGAGAGRANGVVRAEPLRPVCAVASARVSPHTRQCRSATRFWVSQAVHRHSSPPTPHQLPEARSEHALSPRHERIDRFVWGVGLQRPYGSVWWR